MNENKNNFRLLDEIIDGLKDSSKLPSSLPTNIFSSIAIRLDEALQSDSRKELEALETQLSRLFFGLVNNTENLSESIINAIRSKNDTSVAYNAYILGMVNFAQLVASNGKSIRVDDDFKDILTNVKYKAYVDQLVNKDLTRSELSIILKDGSPKTMDQKLSELIELGVIEFRKDNVYINNQLAHRYFLTPAARSIINNK